MKLTYYNQNNRKFNLSRGMSFPLFLILVLSPLFAVNSVPTVNTIGPWYLSKPWNPLKIANNAIPIGQTMEVLATLEAGKRYHIFLVGDWVNTPNPQTDYDIIAKSPYDSLTFTEATGLPEQVSNDPSGQFYVPLESGTYHFLIHNDPEDSHGAQAAIFMIIEHIEVDNRYSTELQGRLAPGDAPKPLYAAGYEFTTSASNITIYVDTPNEIDMFEARVYPMANLQGDGYDLMGQPTPQGAYLNNTYAGDYGGYNTTFEGYRNPLFFASCKSMGDKMEIKMSLGGSSANATSSSNLSSNSSSVTYFLVLIAEYSKFDHTTQIPFYIKTDSTAPEPVLYKPLGLVYANKVSKIYANITSKRSIFKAWVNLTVNGVPGGESINLVKVGDGYECDLPVFKAEDMVKYSICAEDEIGNIGKFDSSFGVKTLTETQCSVVDANILGGSSLDLLGHTTIPNVDIILDFKCGGFRDAITVKSDESGGFKYTYTPKQPGQWSVVSSYKGDAANYPSNSTAVIFSMTPQPTTITCSLSSSEVKTNQPLKLVGSTTPAIAGLPVNVILSSQAGAKTQTIVTEAGGSFSLEVPLEEGDWEIVAQITGNWRYASSSSKIVSATVIPLNLLDNAVIAILLITSPPYIYVLLLVSAVALILIVRLKGSVIAPKVPEPIRGFLIRFSRQTPSKKREATGEKGRYKRQNEET